MSRVHGMALPFEYRALDTSSWDTSWIGKNIFHRLTDQELAVWDAAFQYQDVRNDKGHIEHVVYFALALLEHWQEEVDRSVAMAGAILHDIGWGLLPKEEVALFTPVSDPAAFQRNESYLRKRHQDLGAIKAREILSQLRGNSSYSADQLNHVVEIVQGHDTRQGFYSSEDGLARDADKMWRFTLRCFEVYKPGRDAIATLLVQIDKPGFLYSDIARHIARAELEQTEQKFQFR